MDRFLALPPAERELAFQQAGAARGLAPGSVEKDFWVCLILRELFTLPDHANHLTFKGGTSLSKAWGLIDRFSEDIDLTIDRASLGFSGEDGPEAAPSRTKQRQRIEALKVAARVLIANQLAPALTVRLRKLLSTNESWELTVEADGETILFGYPRRATALTQGYLATDVKLEFGARSDPWPSEERQVTPIAAEVYPDLFDAPAVTVRALRPERTFWEKVMLLHEERYRPAGKGRRARMARHYYDVWRLIDKGVAAMAVADEKLFDQVAAHRQLYFGYSWVDYGTLRRGQVNVLPDDGSLDEWRQDYAAMQGAMFVETPPPFEEILEVIVTFQREFNAA